MALGAITKPLANGRPLDRVDDNRRTVIRDVQCTSGANYTANGEVITPAAVGLKHIYEAYPEAFNATQTRFFVWDKANSKLKVYTAFGTEAVAGTDQSAFVVRIAFVGDRAN